MGRKHYTSIGGDRSSFQTTHWTAIDRARSGNHTCAQRLVNELLNAYWKPVYCYLRSRGHGNEEAKDLTQAFFHEVVLGRDLIQQADRGKGRFRTLLLKSLDRYLISVHRKKTARKRTPQGRLISLECSGLNNLPEVVTTLSAEDTFHYAWVSDLVDRMLADVETECREHNLVKHWNLFRDRVLDPVVNGTKPAPLDELCRKHGIDTPAKASNMIVVVKRRFQAALRRLLRQSVASDGEVCEELLSLMEFLTKPGQDKSELAYDMGE